METVGRLAGGIAHEFNNLLQAIQGYTICAMDGLSQGDGRRLDLQEVLKAVERAALLTRQLLGFSRRSMLQPRNVDVNAMVADFVKLTRPLLGERIEFRTEYGSDVGTVHADPGELHQVLLNLCINSRDAMPSGGRLLLETRSVVLSVPCRNNGFRVEPGPYVRLSVVDTGCGMPPEVREHIFEPFFTTKEVGKGTGLGLAMVYGIVQQHAGMIRVDSEPGNGTTFDVFLPKGGTPDAENAPRTEMRRAPRGTETILVAEDDPAVHGVLSRVLRNAGYSVLVASDGEQAIQLFENNRDRIALAILDAVMPKLTGQQVCRRIRQMRPGTGVIFCTGYDPETARCGLPAEENIRHIEKPIHEEDLLCAVREVLDEARRCHLVGEATP